MPIGWGLEVEMVWSAPESTGDVPSSRAGHSFTVALDDTPVDAEYDEERVRKAVLFAGNDFQLPAGPTNDLFQMNLDTFEWKKIEHSGPEPRSKHSATCIKPNTICVFGGLGGKSRLNDCWLLNTKTMTWSPAYGDDATDVPVPRGGHSACLLDEKLWIMFGYGGKGYGRRDLADIHTLDLDTMKWSSVNPAGESPAARSSHQAVVVEKRIYVSGGWNSTTQLNDISILDTDTMSWSTVDESFVFEEPRWNHSTVAVWSVPNWKIFVFGGNSGILAEGSPQGEPLNDTIVIDTGDLELWKPKCVGTIPEARSDSELLYDEDTHRLILFGGWAGEWFGGLQVLDVAEIVGPPYSLTELAPLFGPITGNAKVQVQALNLEEFVGKPATVRFACNKGFVDAEGEVINETTVECLTPAFTKFGPVPVEVRLSVNNEPFTNTALSYKFHSVTQAEYSMAFGPGVQHGGCTGEKSVFVIQSLDTNGEARDTGGDKFKVKVVCDSDRPKTKKEAAITTKIGDIDIVDNENGTYTVTYIAPKDEGYKIHVDFLGTFEGVAGPIRGSPFHATFESGVAPENNTLDGPLVTDFFRKKTNDLKDFCNKSLRGLRKEVAEGDLDALIKIKEHLRSVEQAKEQADYDLDTVKAMLVYLKSIGKSVDRDIKGIDNVYKIWNDVEKQAPETKQAIVPETKSQAQAQTEKIAKYQTKLEKDVEVFKINNFWDFDTGAGKAREMMEKETDRIKKERSQMEEYSNLCQLFEFPDAINRSRELVEEQENCIEWMTSLWDIIESALEFYAESRLALWSEVKAEDLEDEAKRLMKVTKACNKNIRWCKAYQGIDQENKNFIATVPLVSALHHQSMRLRHWAQLMKATGKTFTPPMEDPNMTLESILSLNLHQFSADVEEICDQAIKEAKMEVGLEALEAFWSKSAWFTDWYKVPHQDDVPLVKMIDEDFEQLEADQLIVQGMMASRYVAQFEEQVHGWQHALMMVGEIVLVNTDVQRTWAYLEPLFIHSDEVKRELPETATKFKGIDTEVKQILVRMEKTKNVKESCNYEGLLTHFEKIQTDLEVCKKSLADFLDGRRRQFPRYYFTSEADLLDILSNGSNPNKILVHVPKIYLATKTFTVDTKPEGADEDEWRPTVKTFIAGVGVEETHFEPEVTLSGKVEIYMQTVLDAMKMTLFKHCERCIDRYKEFSRVDWLMHGGPKQPTDAAQICLFVSAVNYVIEVEQAFKDIGEGDKDAMPTYNQKQIGQLKDLINTTTTSLSSGQRKRVMCMITLDAHNRDIVAKMVRSGVTEVSHFQWQSQLKMYWRKPFQGFVWRDPQLRGAEGQRAEIGILNCVVPYDYEYLGNGPRLVVTPLTDRIYVTATQALNLKMGCAPAGPAGTGKTESTKDLASALGKVCYVFNCSPEMDYQSMGNIYKGLASSGSWGCFDEFNRLIPEVLSVCTVQFKAVCDGIAADAKSCVIEGDEVSLDPTCGAFITMNPGYLGRSELPEGLKALFRPMTVMVPDLVLICENMMMAEGYEEASSLASKFYGLYSLLKQLLSKQLHYDWGLRAVKSVLVVAGGFKRAEPDAHEQALLMRALRDFNIPKIPACDNPIFFGLMYDLFPGIDPPRMVNLELEQKITEACGTLGYTADPAYHLKVVQLEELLAIRHCVFVMGAAGAFKSASWHTLAAARTLLDKATLETKIIDLNPKSIETKELYGYITMATREWRDGLLSKIMRDLGNIPDELPKWILLDGDLDANWIESMNSVMDDNRMLTLASNERIPLKPHMKMIFEIRDLVHATPATVSRAGVLYISSDDGFQYRCMIASWLKARPENDDVKAVLKELFDTYVEPTVIYQKKFIRPILPVEDVTFISTLLFMLEAIIPLIDKMKKKHEAEKAAALADMEEDEDGEQKKPEEVEELPWQQVYATVFVYCLVWSFGAGLTISDDGTDYRKEFSEWWRAEWKQVKFPSRETVFDYYLDPETWKFEPWSKSPFFYTVDYHSSTPMSSVTVPTTETAATSFWMEQLVHGNHPVMLAGPAGTGKTQMILGMLNKQDDNMLNCVINFNFYTSSEVLKTTMEVPLEKKSGMNFGPPGQSKLIYFVDDLNLPEVDSYNTQSAIALLRQQMEYSHIYDIQKLVAKYISNTLIVSCMNPTAGSFVVNPRLQRWYTTFAIGMPGPTSLLTIYQTFLDGHLIHCDFPESVQDISTNLIKAALGLHTQVAQAFRKTAANFHYEFNVRHLSNVFQGMLVAKPANFGNPEKFVHLWLHESERVYGDRLVSGTDLLKFLQMSEAQSKKNFPMFNVAKFFAKENADPLIFCHFADNIQDKIYDQVTNIDSLSTILVSALDEYNETNAAMDLVLFTDAMKHVCRIVRIVQNEGGHALLVGVGGSGKQSLSRLAAFICVFTVKQIVISSTYGINDLKEDLKWMYNKAGLREEGIMFLLTDSQITNERFLIYLNDLLASGDVPDLFGGEDLDNVINGVMPKLKANGITQDKTHAWNFFISEIRRNLHCSLCFSPVGDDFRNRAAKFPALCNCTVIDWFQPWPYDALHAVGKKFLAEVDLGPDEKVRTGIENFMPFSFTTVGVASEDFKKVERRFVYSTPKSYLELLKLYEQLFEKKKAESNAAIERLASGLQKLEETSEAVHHLEEELKVALVAAEEKKVTSEGIAEVVAKEKAVVEKATAEAEVEAANSQKISAEVTIKQRDTEADLAKAIPAVEQAMAALNTLNKKDLSECKTMLKPPGGVDDVFAATMVLLANVHPNVVCDKKGRVKDKSWDAAKKQLLGSIPDYLDALMNYKEKVDTQKVPDINFKEVRPLLALETFDVEIIKGKNSAAGGLCAWVVNIVMYRDIVVTVEPKRIALEQANQQLAAANAKLKEVTELVAELQAKLDKLVAELDAANADKKEAMDSVDRGNKKLDLAQRLTNALASEAVRWAENVVQLEASKNLLVGDVLIASAFISYIGPFTKPFRLTLMNDKFAPFLAKAAGGESIPMSAECDPVNILASAADVAGWQSNKLPADRVSTENGCIVVNSARWPLIIDPQLQGIAWLKQKESDPSRDLQIVRLGQSDLTRKLERAIEGGTSVLIENMGERIDAVLTPVIQRAKTKRGHKFYVKLGDTEVEFHPDFKLFLHTKLGNPHFPPEVQAECTLINFTVTLAGLEDQLLVQVVRKERPDLASESERLVIEDRGFKIKIKELEDQILYKLATAEGDITEDVELIEGLEEAKRISNDIAEKMAKAAIVQANIKETSEKYRSVSARAALLFFLMNDLVKMHTYYIYSLAAFLRVFFQGMEAIAAAIIPGAEDDAGEAEEAEEAEEDEEGGGGGGIAELTDEQLADRCVDLNLSITRTVFNYIRRGLFERDKLTVATMLTLKILNTTNRLDTDDMKYLVESGVSLDAGNMGPLHEWMPEVIWPKVKHLEGLKVFNGLGDVMQSDSDEWREWFDNEHVEGAKIPGDLAEISTFHKLILLRAMRPDRLPNALKKWITQEMSSEYVFQPPLDMPSTYEETNPQTPIFFVLFAGVDPTPWVEEIGRMHGFTTDNGKFVNISMGQGQEKPAEAMTERFAKEGGWSMLQNCHLMQSWVPALERLFEVISEDAHPDFRLFISAEPPPFANWKNMPESLMQSCIKVANEAPSDIKSNLNRAWAEFSQERIDINTKQTEFKGCCFALVWFHALMLGRKKFGQMGWSRAYSFNTGDLKICANVLTDYLDNTPITPWQDLRYIFGEIMYGGHITDAWDRRTCNTYLEVIMHEGIFKKMSFGNNAGKDFVSPDPSSLDYQGYTDYIEHEMVPEAPPLFGMHPNAEIGYLVEVSNSIFDAIASISGGGGGSGGDDGGKVGEMKSMILEQCPEDSEMVGITILLKEYEETDVGKEEGPFNQVVLQECTRMNVLLTEIRRSLVELDKGLKGQLNMSPSMEDLATCMGSGMVPGRNPFHQCNWEGKAWFSMKALVPWFLDLQKRCDQLSEWTEEMHRPFCVWLPGLFNPTAYITAAMQCTARTAGLPLDKMTTETHMTLWSEKEEVDHHPKGGGFVCGLFIEGARWPSKEEVEDVEEIEGEPCGGYIMDSKLKDLLPLLPVIYVKAVQVQPLWEPSSVGYLRHDPSTYEAPIYITQFRGPTYVELATLNTIEPSSKWVLAAVAVMFQSAE